jgi:hypothetical protein
MKKLGLSFIAIFLGMGLAFSQPVSDMGIIPVGVTLNSILRLNIVSGGNIEFVVNTIDQYTNGIAPNALYETQFTVASSVDFDVRMYAENATLLGSDNIANSMPLNNVGYTVSVAGSGAEGTAWTIPTISGANTVEALTSVAATDIIIGIVNAAAGNVAKNAFIVEWQLGTVQGTMNATTLLHQSLPADRYVVNVFIVLESH